MIGFRQTTSRWLLGFAGVAMATTVVGCGSTVSRGSTALGPPPPSRTSDDMTPTAAPAPTKSRLSGRPGFPVPVGPAGCSTADLTASLSQPDSGTGHTGLNIAVTNRSPRSCRLKGFGGLQLLDAAGSRLPTQQVRVTQPPPRPVTLIPGASAYSGLFWVHNPEGAPCEQAAFLLVTPPHETGSIRTAFAHLVCEGGRIQQTPYRPAPI